MVPLESLSIFIYSSDKVEESQVNGSHRHGEQGAVQSVQHPAMTGNEVAGVLDVAAAFPHGLEQIAGDAAPVHQDGEDDAMDQRESEQVRPVQDHCGQDREKQSAPETDPGLLRGNLRRDFPAVFLTEQGSQDIGSDVGTPDDDEETQEQQSAEGSLPEGQQVGKRHRDRDIQQARIDEREFGEFTLVFDQQGVEHDDQDRDDGQCNIFAGHVEGLAEIQQQKEDHAGTDRQGAGELVTLPHRHAIEFYHHRTHRENNQCGEKVPVDQQAAKNR